MSDIKKKYLIYLKSQKDHEHDFDNVYGFYLGKTYQKDYQIFPVSSMNEDTVITEGKFYKTKNAAIHAAKRLLLKCTYVHSYEIIEFPSDNFSKYVRNILHE